MTALLLSLICAAGLLAAGACRQDPQKEKVSFVKRGQQYLKEKRALEARLEFRNALLIDKKYAEAWFGLGEADLVINYLREAFDAFSSVVELDPNNLDARVRLGNIYLQYFKPADVSIREAERLAKEILQKDQNHIEGRILLASVRTSQKRWDEAKAELDRAIALDPKRTESHLSLARFYDQRGKATEDPAAAGRLIDEAEKTFRQAVETDPKSIIARLAISDFYYSNKREAEAEKEMKQAFEIDSGDKLLLAALQRFYENRQDFGEAEKYAQRLASLDPDKNSGRSQVIDLHARAGKTDQAIQEYEQLIKESPKFMRSYSRLAELLLARGDVPGASQRVTEALNINRQDTDALLLRGRLNLLNGRFGDAERDLSQVLKNEPSMPAAMYYMADVHLQNNDAEGARRYINDLLRNYPQSPTGLLMMIRIYLNQNKAQDAIKTADEIINGIAYLKSNEVALQASRLTREMLPDLESKGFTSRAVARLQLKDLAGAQADLDRAAELDQRNPEPHTNLAMLYMLKGDLGRAQAEAEKALELNPKSPQAIATAVNVYVQKKDFATAHAKLDALVAAQPDSPALLDQKAFVFLKQGDPAGYEKTLRGLLEKNSDYLNAYFELSQFYLSQNQADRAIAELQEIIKRRPDNPRQMAQAFLLTGMLQEGRGQFDIAAKSYEQALSYDKRSVGAAIAYNNLAWLLVERIKGGNADKAAEYAKNAIDITPEASFYDTFGWVYYKKQLYGVAIEQFNKALEKAPQSALYHLHLARALRENKEPQKAREAYAQALKIGGDKFAEAKQARDELASLK
ncbi:MAG TPA: tetratricopeptide repeat protein [Blastocatellia bacterium]|nr:tetratricopeptide repeat protein [Blastocatellia bacterium]